MRKPKTYIILVNYNGWEDTIECVESIFKSSYTNYRIIIVDNNSTDNSLDYIINWANGDQEVIYHEKTQLQHLSKPHVKKPIEYVLYNYDEAIKGGNPKKEKKYKNPIILIQTGHNGGFAFGNNVGIRYALAKGDCDAVLLLNNDTVIEPDTLKNIVGTKEQYGNNSLYGGRILYYDKPDILWYDGGHFNEWLGRCKHINENKKMNQCQDVRKVNFITFCYVLIPKVILDTVGLIDERYFMYVEDLDYCYKVQKAGFSLYHVCNSRVWHKVGSSYGGGVNPFSSYYYYRNSLIFRLTTMKPWKKYIAVVYYFLRLPALALKWLLLKPRICKVLLKGTFDALRIYEKL